MQEPVVGTKLLGLNLYCLYCLVASSIYNIMDLNSFSFYEWGSIIAAITDWQ